MGRVRRAILVSALILVVCGVWLAQTVFWPNGGTATDLRPLWPMVAAFLLLAVTWLGTVWSTALDAYFRLRRGDEPHD